MKKFIPIIGLVLTLILLIYLESPYSLINKDHVRVYSLPNEVLRADVQWMNEQAESEPVVSSDDEPGSSMEESEENTEAAQDYLLEMVLEEKSVVDGYTVETYREYEFYKNEHGEVIKKVPTGNFDYVRYYNE